MEQLNQIIDPATGLPLGAALWQQIALSLFGIATILIGVAGMFISNLARKHLPAWINAMIDEKRKNDVHQAAVTIARRIILEGGDPRMNMQMGVDYMIESAKDAFERWQTNGRSANDVKTIFGNILISKIPDIVKELGMGINMPQPGDGQPGEMVAEPLATMDAGETVPAENPDRPRVPVEDAVPHAR